MNVTRRQIIGTAAGCCVFPALAAGTESRADAGESHVSSPKHIVLLGDSVFDNKRYIGIQPSIVEQLRGEVPDGWDCTLCAADGSTTVDVANQLRRLPTNATHLVISAGGNDALAESGILSRAARNASEVFLSLANVRERFEIRYVAMVEKAIATKKPIALCTIYDPRFEDQSQQRMCVAALSVFNDVITRCAAKFNLPVIDLRVIFSSPDDYANAIEPGPIGGKKLVSAIIRAIS